MVAESIPKVDRSRVEFPEFGGISGKNYNNHFIHGVINSVTAGV